MKKYIGLLIVLGILTFGATKVQAVVSVDNNMGCLPSYRYSPITGQPCGSSIVIPIGNPVISGISGPQFLDINSVGTWKVEAYNPTGGNLSYKVDWGDNFEYCAIGGGPCPRLALAESPFGQSATFTHRYLRDGVYNPTFTVRNDKGGTATTSLSVKVGKTDSKPSVTVDSPNTGDVYQAGQQIEVWWKSRGLSTTSYNTNVYVKNIKDNGSVFYIHKNFIQNNGHGLFTLPERLVSGEYRLYVAVLGEDTYLAATGESNIFRIKGHNENINGPIIHDISGPKILNVNEEGTWKVIASDRNNRALSYSVDWGDEYNRCLSGSGLCTTAISSSFQQFATFSHRYLNPGTYIIRFTVKNSDGKTTTKSLSVEVGKISMIISPSPITTYEDCTPGNVYSRTTGQKCLPTQIQTNIQSPSAKIITRGTISNEVKTVQSALTKQGYPLTTDGNFGPKTEEAVKKFQTMRGLPVTGIIDDKTMSLLLSYILAL